MPLAVAVSVSYAAGLATVLLDRPACLNALLPDHLYQLAQALRDIDQRPDIHITLLTGRGRYFSA